MTAESEAAGGWVYCLKHEPKRDLLAVGGRGKRIAFLSGRDLSPLRGPLRGFGWVKEFKFGPEGKLLAVMGLSRRARAIEVETGRRLWISPATPIYAFTMDLSPEGRLVAVAYEDWTVRYFDAWTGEIPIPSLKLSQTAMALAFSPNSSELAVGIRDGWLLIVDHRSGRTLHRLKHDGAITAVAYTGDGSRVVSASEDGFARAWDAREGRLSAPPMDHGARVIGLALDPAGKRMLTGCRDGHARLWDVDTGLEIGDSVAHQAPVAMVRVSRDGRWAGSAEQDGVARIWRLPEAGLGDRAPDWFADFLEAKVASRVEKDGRTVSLTSEEIAERLARVPSGSDDPFVAAVKQKDAAQAEP